MKTIFFDFDGTLTIKSPNIWKAIWERLGYDTGKESYFRQLYGKFMDGTITHQEWCDLTCQAFAKRGMNKQILKELASNIKLLPEVRETFQILKENGFEIFILSGNIVEVIEDVLRGDTKYIDAIMANVFVFDKDGMLEKIVGTNYDFEGKAKFIEEYKQKTYSDPNDLYFVGNGDNDEWAHLSGCHTICINPDGTDVNDNQKWHKNLGEVKSLSDILPEVKFDDFENEQHNLIN